MIRLCRLVTAMTVSAGVIHAQAPVHKPPVPGAPTGITAFVDVAVVPLDIERILPGQTVLVEGGRITAFGPSDKMQVPARATPIDGRGKYLIPGLSECHAHLGMYMFRVVDAMRSDTIAALERALLLLLANGITTVHNLDYLSDMMVDRKILLALRARAAAGELWSPRLYTSGPWWGQEKRSSGHVALDSVATYIAAYQAAGFDFVKIHDEDSARFSAVMGAARRLDIPVVGHVPRWITAHQALALGYASITHLLGYSAADTAEYRALAAATKEAGVWNCPTLTLLGDDRRENPDGGLLIAKTLQNAGAGLLLGTDAPVGDIRLGFAIHRELAAMVRAGLTPYQALLTGTRNMAQYLGLLDESGTVAVGKRADLVLLTGNPLQDIRHTFQPAGVMIGGRWLVAEAMAQRLAALAAGSELQHLVLEQRKLFYADDAVHARWELWGEIHRSGQLSRAQHNARFLVEREHNRAVAALLDTVVAGSEDTAAVRRRVWQLVVRQHEKLLEILTPEQRAVFEAKVQVWRQRYSRSGDESQP